MAMASTSLSSFSLLSPAYPQTLKSSKTPIFSLLSSPKPRFRRKNHLRPKLRQPEPATLQAPELPLLIGVPEQEEEEWEKVEAFEPVELVEPVQESAYQSQTLEQPLNPNPIPGHWSSLLSISLRFVALIAVQTVVAVWFLGGRVERENGEEERGVKVLAGEEVVGEIEREEGKEGDEFERMVAEIREMARAARAQEVKEVERSGIERETVGPTKVVEKGKGGNLVTQKRLGFVRPNVRRVRANAGKGFDGVKKVEEDGNGGDDGKEFIGLSFK